MSSNFGKNINVSIFGESHGRSIGCVISGLPAGLEINMDEVYSDIKRRAPGGKKWATNRVETDEITVLSGFFNSHTTGTPLTMTIDNNNTISKDYSALLTYPRPGHADYTASVRYGGFQDYRGGGHFSGRLTTPLVAAGSIAKQFLAKDGIFVGGHVKSIRDITDNDYGNGIPTIEQLKYAASKDFPAVSDDIGQEMIAAIDKAKKSSDSLGGVITTGIFGMPAGLGSPMFASLESKISAAVFSVPSVKGIEFGAGFDITKLTGSQANDEFFYDEEKNITTKTLNNGGILGGISVGGKIVFSTAIKPTASVGKKQNTVNLKDECSGTLEVVGRHDPCIVPRAVVVIEAVTALVILDEMLERYGWEHYRC